MILALILGLVGLWAVATDHLILALTFAALSLAAYRYSFIYQRKLSARRGLID